MLHSSWIELIAKLTFIQWSCGLWHHIVWYMDYSIRQCTAYIFLSYNVFVSVDGEALKMKKVQSSTKEALISRFIENHYNGDALKKFMVCELYHKQIFLSLVIFCMETCIIEFSWHQQYQCNWHVHFGGGSSNIVS